MRGQNGEGQPSPNLLISPALCHCLRCDHWWLKQSEEVPTRCTGKHSDREQLQRPSPSRRVWLSERVHAGMAKARRAGRFGGRPSLVVDRDPLAQLDEEGWTTGEIGDRWESPRRLSPGC